jgi:MoaA/NifB/PqqE/SkfB family radical SAM enzyme
MYRFEDIREVHLELTSRCNAACPQCPRSLNEGITNPDLPLTELSLSDIKRVFEPRLIRQLRHIYLCGNYGDPMMAHDTLDVLRYFRMVNPRLHLTMHTNGSGRNSAWWAEAATLLNVCRFGVDGLEDTNHIYRRNTHWEVIMASVDSYISAGGVAEWDYLVFAHNEHQIQKAAQLAIEKGFRKFFVKRTSRFSKAGKQMRSIEIKTRSGELVQILQPPQAMKLQNQQVVRLNEQVSSTSDYLRYIDETPIHCQVAHRHSVYVSAEALVMPCCFMANLYPSDLAASSAVQVWAMIDHLPEGKRSLSARAYTVQEIINSVFFQHLVPQSWNQPSVNAGRLSVCAHHCGEIHMDQAQYGTSLI